MCRVWARSFFGSSPDRHVSGERFVKQAISIGGLDHLLFFLATEKPRRIGGGLPGRRECGVAELGAILTLGPLGNRSRL
jgi:hypothetical protein